MTLAVAISNFYEPFPVLPEHSSTSGLTFLPFYIGERLQILTTADEWCYGHVEGGSISDAGLFPSTFVERLPESKGNDDDVVRRASGMFFGPEESRNLLEEITTALKYWWSHIKKLYAIGLMEADFKKYVTLMRELMQIRKRVLSGNVPTEELRELRLITADKIDLGNHWLGLGMHIRDEIGKILQIEDLSVVEAYRQHEKAFNSVTSDRSLNKLDSSNAKAAVICITLNQTDLKLAYDAELSILLWNSQQRVAITEAEVFDWSKETGRFKLGPTSPLAGMFIGLTDQELLDDKLELAAALTVMAPIDIALSLVTGKAFKPESISKAELIRQPLAEARLSLADKLRDVVDKEKRELRLVFKPLISPEKFASRKSEICLEITIQRVTGVTLDAIKIRHPEVFAVPRPTYIRRLVPRDVKDLIEEERNEVFLKLGAADLHAVTKHNDKNVEAVLQVYDDEGTPISNCFERLTPDRYSYSTVYKTRVFCLNDRPQFDEQIKLMLPAELSRDLHIRVLFYNKKSYDKIEKKAHANAPFALSYLRLISNSILERQNPADEMLVYKLDKYEDRNVGYLRLSSTKSDIKTMKPTPSSSSHYTLVEKCSLSYEIKVHSMVHTCDMKLYQMLKFLTAQIDVESKISAIVNYEAAIEEIIKFLPQFCDSLMTVLTADVKGSNDVVFRALTMVVKICENFKCRELLDEYVETLRFSRVYKPLLTTLIHFMDEAPRSLDSHYDPLLPGLKSLPIVAKLIVQSKNLYEDFHPEENVDIEPDVLNLLNRLKRIVTSEKDRMTWQNTTVMFLPAVIATLIDGNAIDPIKLAHIIVEMLDGMSMNIFTRYKIMFLGDIVATDMFLNPECRAILLPRFLDELVIYLSPFREAGDGRSDSDDTLDTIKAASTVLADIVERLFPFSQVKAVYQSGADDQLAMIVEKTTRHVCQTVIALLSRKTSPQIRALHAVLLVLLNKFSTSIFVDFLAKLTSSLDKLDFVAEMLHLFRDLLQRPAFPKEWYQMHFLQVKSFTRMLSFMKSFLLNHFRTPPPALTENDEKATNFIDYLTEPTDFGVDDDDATDMAIMIEFFHTAAVFIQSVTEKSPEDFTSLYGVENGKMREYAANMMRSMWMSLTEEHKCWLLDKILVDLLTVTLIGNDAIQSTMIKIFFDMLEINLPEGRRFVDDFIVRLDPLIDGAVGGDAAFRTHFRQEFLSICTKENLKQVAFVERIDTLLGLLLNLRQVHRDGDCIEAGKLCLVQLINFYASIDQHVLKVRHLVGLYEMHAQSGCHVEAALTLRRVAELLEWEDLDAEIPDFLLSYSRGCRTAAALREAMFIEMADLFDKGEHWEKAIAVLQELIPYYENVLIDYGKLSMLHRRLSELYAKVNSTLRMESYYFYVVFYGTGFPEYWANRKFVFRGDKLEKLGDFKFRMMNKFYGAQAVDTIKNSDHLSGEDGRFLQIIPITPIQSASSLDSSAGVLLRWYHKHHGISSFELLRAERRDDTKWTTVEKTEATQLWVQRRVMTVAHPLPDILNFAPVEFEEEPPASNPVDVAISRVEEVNASLRETAELVANGFTEYTGPLGGKIIGVLKADVGGGVKSYESFFSDEIKDLATPDELILIKKLRKTLLNHVGIIEYCLYVHAARPQLIAETFHSTCVDLFLDYRRSIETRFGKAVSYLASGNSIYLPASGSLAAASNNLSAASFVGTNTQGGSNSSISLEDGATGDGRNMFMRVGGTLLRSTASRARSSAATLTLQREKKTSFHGNAGPSLDFDNTSDAAEMAYILRNVIRHTVVDSPMTDSVEMEDSGSRVNFEDLDSVTDSISTVVPQDRHSFDQNSDIPIDNNFKN